MFKLDQEIIELMKLIEDQNQEIYIVGGFVRDLYLNHATRDLDMATSMPIKQIKKTLTHYEIKDYNENYGSIKFELKSYEVEITQFRKDSHYVDARHPAIIEFTNQLNEDVLRRDFKMNALYMNKEGQVIDPIGGLHDLELKRISTVRDAFLTFSEDALRVVRLYRFHAQLNFEIEGKTLKAAIQLLPNIQRLKPIQYKKETIKILSSGGLAELVKEHKNFIQNLLPKAKFPEEVFNLKTTWEYKLLYMFNPEDLDALLKAWQVKSKKRKYLLAFKRIMEDYKINTLEDLFIKHGSFMWFEMMTLFLNLNDDFIYRDKFLKILSIDKGRSLTDLEITGQDLIDLEVPERLRNQFFSKLLFDHIWNDLENNNTALREEVRRYKNDIH